MLGSRMESRFFVREILSVRFWNGITRFFVREILSVPFMVPQRTAVVARYPGDCRLLML